MLIKSKSAIRRFQTLAMVCVVAGGVTGCAVVGNFLHRSADLISKGAPSNRHRPHPMLAAARANRISMFGELGSPNEQSYFTRAAVSLKQHSFTDIGSDADVDLGLSGKVMVFSSTRHNVNPALYMKSIDGVAVTQLTGDPASDVQPILSPDGSRVAFTSNRGGQWDIWVKPVSSGQPIRITDSAAEEIHPSWSPDGSEIVYCSLPSVRGQWELWVADAESGATRKFIGYGLFPEWSPDGGKILYQRARERGSNRFSIWTLTLVDGEPRYPTELASSAIQALTLPTWSPDGARVAYTSVAESLLDKDGEPIAPPVMDIWLMSANGMGQVRLTDGHSINYAPTFAPDGRVFFTSNRGGFENIWSLWPATMGQNAPQGELFSMAQDPAQSAGRFGPVAQGQ